MSEAQNKAASAALGEQIFAITPNDGAVLPVTARAIVFKTVGALHILDGSGVERTIPSGVLAVGIIHRFTVTKVFNTGTGASMDIWGIA